ncbi:hypothetical protein [Acinetobacter johnsonii]|uniref:hypothetical protein n=1 Tax=Acinetobacter johnsonii TaxID=40214 RepID=UPI001F1E4506|nr:hypothetical protein [Acinetobacter johnsonii]MCF7642737.1 hypothetical protein [Acinetobacter johnsonii]
MPLITPNKVNHSTVDTFEANKFIAHSTGLDLRPQNVNSLNIRIPVPAAPCFPISDYWKAGKEILYKRALKMSSLRPTGYSLQQYGYLTPFGASFLPIVQNIQHNPLFGDFAKNIAFNPLAEVTLTKMYQHGLFCMNFDGSTQCTDQYDSYFSDLKVTCTTRQFQQRFSRWAEQYNRSGKKYDEFMENVYNKAPIFEVHSLVILRKAVNDQNKAAQYNGFVELNVDDILSERANEIIKLVMRNSKRNDVIGVLSKREFDIHLNHINRLIFFVKKDSSDWMKFSETQLYKDLEPHFIDTPADHIALGCFPSMNTGIAPLFQQQETNFYNINQLHVGHRLAALKSHLVGSDFWLRYNDQLTLKIEREVQMVFGKDYTE